MVSCPAALETLEEQVWLRFVEDRPISAVTTQFLAWCCEKQQPLGKKALLMICDNASWHSSHEVRNWMRAHDREMRQQGKGLRIRACYLPGRSPWLKRIEPHGVHGERDIVEPARLHRSWPMGSVPTSDVDMSRTLLSQKGRLTVH